MQQTYNLDLVRADISNINQNVKEILKMIDSLHKSVDLVYQDRDLLKDIYSQGEATKALISVLDQHNELITKDLKADIKDTKSKVEETTGNLADTIQKKTIIKIKDQGFFKRFFKWKGG